MSELFVKRGMVSDPAGSARLAQLVGREKGVKSLLEKRPPVFVGR